MSRNPTLRTLTRILLFVVATVITLGCLEAGLRLRTFLTRQEPAVPGAVGRFDSRLGWSLRPGAVASSSRTGAPVEYRINSEGLRDAETPYEKPQGTRRIVLLGDSRTFGLGVPIESHFSRLLEVHLADVEVVNLGVSGFGVDQMVLFMELEGFRYDPDVVLLYLPHFGSNRHMHSGRFGRDKPYFVQSESGELVLKNSPVARPPGKTSLQRTEIHKALQRVRARFGRDPETGEPTESAVYDLAATLILKADEECRERGMVFVLATQLPELHRTVQDQGVLSVDVSAALSGSRYDLPNGLSHINAEGNRVLAQELVSFLGEVGLIHSSTD